MDSVRTSADADELPRVHTLDAALADQIAAGEVVERPASVVRELVDNAIDAGATRIDVELVDGGRERIVVTDDGHGIHPDDLQLAVTRHATSKVRRAADLVDIATLGFRGEALASVAAVATVKIRSRRLGSRVGQELIAKPGRPLRQTPTGLAVGTRIEVESLFENVPARRKFLRSEATEVGHVVDAVTRVALVHPRVHFVVRTPRRMLLDFASAADEATRIEQVLHRRGRGVLRHVGGHSDGIAVDGWVLDGDAVPRAGQGAFVVVRRRVVREKNLARLLRGLAPELPEGRHPIGCLRVEPGPGEVDVNVHPQKAEIRFSDPQRVYAAVRAVLSAARPAAPTIAPIAVGPRPPAIDDVVARWAAATPVGGEPSRGSGTSYRLRTEARGDGYAAHRRDVRAQAQQLSAQYAASPVPIVADQDRDDEAPVDDGPAYLACLPGPVGLFRDGDDLLAVDLRALRSHLVYRRVREDLGRAGTTAQALLSPVVVDVGEDDLRCVTEGKDALDGLGLVVEPFGDGTVMVRAVPAGLRGCIEEPDVADLVRRVLPWLRVRARDDGDLDPAMRAIAATDGPDPAPRLARRWLRDLARAGEDLGRIPGVSRWSPGALVGAGGDDDDRRD